MEDAVTRYVEVAATRNTQAQTVKDCFVRAMQRWGVPEVIHTDNAPYFVGEIIAELCEQHNIVHSLSPPHWPQANPVERANRVIKTILKMYLGRDHRNWDTHLREAVYAYNTVPHSSLGNISPAYLNFGRELRPLDYRRGAISPRPDDMRQDIDRENRVERMQELRNRVRELIRNASQKQKFYYDKKHREVEYQVN